mmetsp:Transcript_18115/g.39567  ORF Transcript_18115/g.39567 Transcript_18115/m.39567 type:complete len:149 (-) Transcript_18115:315-761(-)
MPRKILRPKDEHGKAYYEISSKKFIKTAEKKGMAKETSRTHKEDKYNDKGKKKKLADALRVISPTRVRSNLSERMSRSRSRSRSRSIERRGFALSPYCDGNANQTMKHTSHPMHRSESRPRSRSNQRRKTTHARSRLPVGCFTCSCFG